MILGRPQDTMASRFRQAVQCVLGFWTQLAAQCEQFCCNHRELIRGGMVLLKPLLQGRLRGRTCRIKGAVDIHSELTP